jgi:hypothetical protein
MGHKRKRHVGRPAHDPVGRPAVPPPPVPPQPAPPDGPEVKVDAGSVTRPPCGTALRSLGARGKSGRGSRGFLPGGTAPPPPCHPERRRREGPPELRTLGVWPEGVPRRDGHLRGSGRNTRRCPASGWPPSWVRSAVVARGAPGPGRDRPVGARGAGLVAWRLAVRGQGEGCRGTGSLRATLRNHVPLARC